MSLMNKITKSKGKTGEDFVDLHCRLNNASCVKTTDIENIKLGVDRIIDGKPTDIKNTNDIYFLRYDLKLGKCIVRHPFRVESVATHYCLVNADSIGGSYIFREHIGIDEYLLRDWFLSSEDLEIFKSKLKKIDKKAWNELGYVSLDQFCRCLKMDVFSSHIKKEIQIRYSDLKTTPEDEISFRLTQKKKDSAEGFDLQASIQQMKDKLSIKKRKVENEPDMFDDGLIVVQP